MKKLNPVCLTGQFSDKFTIKVGVHQSAESSTLCNYNGSLIKGI